MSDKTVQTFCRICEALCGLEVDVDENAGRVLAVRPDPDHVATAGFACIKGLRQHEIYDAPERLRVPMRQARGGEGPALVESTWPQALGDIGRRVQRLRSRHGPDSIAMYVGTAAGFSFLHPIFAQGFMTGIGSKNIYASATQDCSNKFAVARHMYGFPFTQPFPDVDRTQCLIIVGGNPAVSKWSFGQVPNPVRRLKELVGRGGRLFVVDPRRTETAKAAGEHVFIRPRTDVFFYLSFLHEVLRRDAIAGPRVERWMRGLDSLRTLAQPWTAERTASVTGIDAGTLRRLVDAYLGADGAALYCSTGVNMGSQGSLAFWLQEAINAITGNLDRYGGTLVGRGIVDFPKVAHQRGLLMRDDRSRVGGYPAVNDAFPGGVLADEILTPGAGQIRALFVTGGNPLLTMANSGRLREAFESLELLVVLDILPSETATVADWVLPCTSPLQRWDLPFIFPLMLGLQTTPYLQATRPVVAPEAQQRDEATIYLDLCRACGVDLFGSKVAQRVLDTARAAYRLGRGRQAGVPQPWLMSALLRGSGHGGLSELLAHKHGRLREPHRADDFLGKRVLTDDGRVDLAPPVLLEAARDLHRWFVRERGQLGGLRLITRRAVTTHNSWTHNHPKFVGRQGTNYLYIHPADAERIGLADGELADVATDTATVRVPISCCRDLMPGTVALPHGWGHQGARGLRVASQTRGVNVNLLAADGPGQLEAVSGMAHLTGLDVRVSRAAGPQSEADWSGVKPSVTKREPTGH